MFLILRRVWGFQFFHVLQARRHSGASIFTPETSLACPNIFGMPKDQRSIRDEGLEVAGYNGLEVAPLEGLEVIPQEGLEVADSWTESLDNLKKDLIPEKDSRWRKRTCGHSTRFWTLIAISIASLVLVVTSAAVAISANNKHRRR